MRRSLAVSRGYGAFSLRQQHGRAAAKEARRTLRGGTRQRPALALRALRPPGDAPRRAHGSRGAHDHRAAPGCTTQGAASREHTWFAGYAWRIANCASCLGHLGWRYERGADGFFGLILERLAEEN
jgi:hypothetical protein